MYSLGTPASLPYNGKTIAVVDGKRLEVTAFQLFLLREQYGRMQWEKDKIEKEEIKTQIVVENQKPQLKKEN